MYDANEDKAISWMVQESLRPTALKAIEPHEHFVESNFNDPLYMKTN